MSSPRSSLPSPRGSLPSPEELVIVSEELVTVPEELVIVPEELVTVPEEVVTVPEELVIVSEELVTVPEELVIVPEELVTVSEELVIVSEELVIVPEELVTVPEEFVTVPEELVTVPEELVIVPEELVISIEVQHVRPGAPRAGEGEPRLAGPLVDLVRGRPVAGSGGHARRSDRRSPRAARAARSTPVVVPSRSSTHPTGAAPAVEPAAPVPRTFPVGLPPLSPGAGAGTVVPSVAFDPLDDGRALLIVTRLLERPRIAAARSGMLTAPNRAPQWRRSGGGWRVRWRLWSGRPRRAPGPVPGNLGETGSLGGRR